MELWTPKILQFDTTNRRVTMINALVAELVDKMFDLCPVDTGALRNSIVSIIKVEKAGGSTPIGMALMVPAAAGINANKQLLRAPPIGEIHEVIEGEVYSYLTVNISTDPDFAAARARYAARYGEAKAVAFEEMLKRHNVQNIKDAAEVSEEMGAAGLGKMLAGVPAGWALLIADLADDLIAANAIAAGAADRESAIPDARVTAQVYLSMLNYGEIVEFGTLTRSPSPFIRPVLHQHSCLIEDLGGEILI